MPLAQITAPNAPWGYPLTVNDGLNDQILVAAVNNSGGHLQHGDVVAWDTNTALSAAQTTTVGVQVLAVTATSYTVVASAGFTFPSIVVANQVTPTGFTSPVNLTGLATAAADGTHITVAFSRVGGAASLPAGTTITQTPSSVLPGVPTQGLNPVNVIGLPAAPSDAGRVITVSKVAAGLDPLIAGVVSATADASTNAALIPPGDTCWVCVSGVARVQIAATAVAAGGLLTSGAAQPTIADDIPATLGNLLGVALESQAAKDANNTIRAAIKVG